MSPALAKIRKLDREHRKGASGLSDDAYRWLRNAWARDGMVTPPPAVPRRVAA